MGPIVSAVATALSGVIATAFGLFANILGIISGAFLWASVNIFNFVLSPDFISLSFTDPARNPFLEIGWGLTRDFANIIIVLALVVIGLGTALRLAGYQAQKTLLSLILIALLINFTPVICGLIVDASNILMSFFVGEGFAGGNSFINASMNQWANISSLVGGLKLWDPIASQEAIAAAIGSYISAFFNFYAAVIYLIFAMLFILRYVAIWVLVILSPLAFACYILPDTRKVFTQWWTQFIQWSFIGVTGAFFLYLGDHFLMATKSTDFIQSTIKEVGSAPGLSSILNNIMPYAIALVFLTIGLMLTLSSSAAGASGVMNFAQKKGGQAGQWISKRGKAFARSRVPEGVRRWGERQMAAKRWGEGEKGIKGWAKRQTSAPLVGIQRGMGSLVSNALSEKVEYGKAYEKAKTQNLMENLKDLRGTSSKGEQAAISKAMQEQNQWPDVTNSKKLGRSAMSEGELMKQYEQVLNNEDEDTASTIERAGGTSYAASFGAIRHKLDPDKYKENGLTDEDVADNIESYHHKMTLKLRTEKDFKQLHKGFYNEIDPVTGKETVEYLATSPHFTQKQYESMAMHQPGATKRLFEFCKNKGPEWLSGFNTTTGRMNAPNMPKILSSSAANATGRGMIFNLKEINQKMRAETIVRQNPALKETLKSLEEMNRFYKERGSAQTARNDRDTREAQQGIDRIKKILEVAKRDAESKPGGTELRKQIENLENIYKRKGRS